jgi:tetratricopeptide (TPR) repeat protein
MLSLLTDFSCRQFAASLYWCILAGQAYGQCHCDCGDVLQLARSQLSRQTSDFHGSDQFPDSRVDHGQSELIDDVRAWIVDHQVRDGQLRAAVETLRGIRSPRRRAGASVTIIEGLISCGEFMEAEHRSLELVSDWDRVTQLCGIAVAYHARGLDAQAARLLEQAKMGSDPRTLRATEVAKVNAMIMANFVLVGRREQAFSVLRGMDGMDSAGILLTMCEDFPELPWNATQAAIDLIRDLLHRWHYGEQPKSDDFRGRLAMLAARHADRKRATAELRCISDETKRDYFRGRCVCTYALRVGISETATEIASIKNDLSAAGTLVEVAEMFAAKGRLDDANVLVAEAERRGRSSQGSDRTPCLAQAALGYATIGRDGEAERLCGEDRRIVEEAGYRIIKACLRQGRPESAERFLETLTGFPGHSEAILALSTAYADLGRLKRAWTVASRLESVHQRKEAALRISMALAHAGRLRESIDLLGGIGSDEDGHFDDLRSLIAESLARRGRANEAMMQCGKLKNLEQRLEGYRVVGHLAIEINETGRVLDLSSTLSGIERAAFLVGIADGSCAGTRNRESLEHCAGESRRSRPRGLRLYGRCRD